MKLSLREGGFSVSSTDVPESITCDEDRVEALTMAEDALVAASLNSLVARKD